MTERLTWMKLDKVIRGGKWELVTLWKTMNHENSNIVGTMPDDSWISPDNAPGMKNYFIVNFWRGCREW